ncbi:MAG: ATP synthase F1 subunit delta [Planctomycetes bacterium]|nr:ATP synthase F1 subunit delta [Planctomycetota bacterium]
MQNSELFNRVERVYAMSLLELAEEAGQLPKVAEDVRTLAQLAEEQPQLLTLLTNRRIDVRRRGESVDRIFKGRISDLTLKFLHVMSSRDRFDELPGIAAAFLSLVRQRVGEVEVNAFVARTMPDDVVHRLTAALEQSLKRKPMLAQHVEPGLIGGVKLRIGDNLIDGSVVTQLRLMREKLIEAGRARARQDVETAFKS